MPSRLFRNLCLALVVCLASSLVAGGDDAAASGDVLRPIEAGKKWGYVDGKGVVAIEPQFRDAGEFHDGRAAVNVDGKWGYIDEKGQVAVAAEYSEAGAFVDGVAVVEKKDGKTKLARMIDTSGKVLVEIEATKDRQPRESAPGGWWMVREKGDGPPRHVFLGRDGARLEGEWRDAQPFSEGLAAVGAYRRNESSGTDMQVWSYIGTDGKVALEGGWYRAGRFSDGRAFVEHHETGRRFIDKEGKTLFELKMPMNDIRPFSEGMAAFQGTEARWGFIDATGKVVIEPTFESVGDFHDGRATFDNGGRMGFLDKEGKEHIAGKEWRLDDFLGGLARFRNADRSWGYIDVEGKEVWAAKR